MPQLHFYVPEEVAERIREKAKAKNMSVSKYVAETMKREAHSGLSTAGTVRGCWKSTAFCDLGKARYGFDSVQDGELSAARLLAEPPGAKAKAWEAVWRRFAESPRRYPKLPELLRRAKPAAQGLFDISPIWPQDNDDEEKRLRSALMGLKDKPQAEAMSALKPSRPSTPCAAVGSGRTSAKPRWRARSS